MKIDRVQRPVMELELLFAEVNVGGKVKAAAGRLPGANKSQGKPAGRRPADLPVEVAAVEIQTGKAFKNRVRIAPLKIDVRQEWVQSPPRVEPDQQLVKTAARRVVPAGLVVVSRNRYADERSDHQRVPEHIVS